MASKRDRIQIGPEIEPGVRIGFRENGSEDQLVEVHAHKEGKPISPGVTYAHIGRADAEGWREVTVLHGPPQVATAAYREGYDRIFGKKQKVGLA